MSRAHLSQFAEKEGEYRYDRKKEVHFKAPLEVFAKSIVQPMMYLSVAGILLIVGIILTNKTICAVIPCAGPGPFQLVGAVVHQSLMFIINNLRLCSVWASPAPWQRRTRGHASADRPDVVLPVSAGQ